MKHTGRVVYGNSIVVLLALATAGCGDRYSSGTEDGGTDAEAPAVCGDGVLSSSEACDTDIELGEPGACPIGCDDANDCTVDAIVGEDCQQVCEFTAITEIADDDGCCPEGANTTTDNDCGSICGNGLLEPGEGCDPGIATGDPGACPASCADPDPCTADLLVGDGTCDATCTHSAITAIGPDDGCCPPGGNATSDADCAVSCGDGVVSSGESCDTAIGAGDPGACPTACVDPHPCTADTLTGGGTCQAACTYPAITTAINGDGCCPSGVTIGADNDCPAVCGDGLASSGESCDTAIGAGSPGACPTACSDSDPCTQDVLVDGSTCDATCTYPIITTVGLAEGCCPAGGNANTDPDCSAVCGNGVVESGETCDTNIAAGSPGACPVAADCVDPQACTEDNLVNPGTCTAECQNPPITTPIHGDGCCPAGATVATDDDCSASCGDGVVSSGETCDTAIATGDAGACPVAGDCVNPDPCIVGALVSAGTCSAACSDTPITAIGPSDGCCPSGANANNDGDCPATCGDGVITSSVGELCDIGIAAGDPGACPTACSDGLDCTEDNLVDAGTCTAECQHPDITTPINGDGCCPPGETLATDDDCPIACGDTVVSVGETCDTAIAAGNAGACPVAGDCVNPDPCIDGALVNAGTCDAECSNTTITAIGTSDGCCPAGGNETNDGDCDPVCGNWVTETGEACDDGNTNSGDGCSSLCQVEILPTAHRIDWLAIRDPHFFALVFYVFCTDITGSLNDEINAAITTDSVTPTDGLLDLSLVALFRPLDQGAATSPLEIRFPDCTDPMATTTCSPGTDPVNYTTATNQSAGTCLSPIADTVSGYTPPVTNATAPCYASGSMDLTISMGGIDIPLRDAQVGATYVGNPATGEVNGLIRGFLTNGAAEATVFPPDTQVVGGATLASLLPGHSTCCSSDDDRDSHPTHGIGWWLYMNFTATPVTWTEP